MDKDYLLDGQPVSFVRLIEFARQHGYQPDTLALTSEAVAILRRAGYTVENATGKETT